MDYNKRARLLAKANSKRTFIGLPCSRGHYGERYTCNGICIKCAKDNAAKHRTGRPIDRKPKFMLPKSLAGFQI